MDFGQPKPYSKVYSDLISDIENGVIKILKSNASLSGVSIMQPSFGTASSKAIPSTPEGTKVEYVLDGQQRIAFLFAANMFWHGSVFGLCVSSFVFSQVRGHRDSYVVESQVKE